MLQSLGPVQEEFFTKEINDWTKKNPLSHGLIKEELDDTRKVLEQSV